VTAPRLSPGQAVAGKYTIRTALGYGGATATYSAQVPPGRDVVVKVFSPQIAQRPDVLGVLQLVATVTASLGDAAAPVLESGFDPQTGAPYLVTDLSPLPSLAQTVERGVLTAADVVLVLRGIARAVDAAHGQRLVHGALKPANVFVGPGPQRAVRVSDFGVAIARSAVPTQEGFAIAAPWMAPEQMQGSPGTPASDVFSAALVAFHALTGKSFWRSCQGPQPDFAALQQEVGAARPAPSSRARELGVTLPTGLDGALGRALSLNPAERYTSIGDLADTLAKAGGAAGKMAQTMPLSAMPQAAQDMLRRVAAQPQGQQQAAQQQAAAQQAAFEAGSTLAVSAPSELGWPPGPQAQPQAPPQPQGQPMGMQPPMQQAMPQPMQQGMQPPQGMQQQQPQGSPMQQQQQPVLTPYGGFQAPPQQPPGMQPGSMPPMGGPMGQAAPMYPQSESVVVPKSKGGLFIILALVGLVVVAAVVVVVVILRQRAVEATLPAEATSQPAQTAASTGTAPPASAAATAAATASTAPAVETQPAGSASSAPAASGSETPQAAAPDQAELTIVCVPDCETVSLDDKALDANDAGVVVPDPMSVAAGAHTIAVTKTGYLPQTKKVTLKPGQKAKQTFFMTKPGAVVTPKPCGKFLERCPN
jgi:hypothetical protein